MKQKYKQEYAKDNITPALKGEYFAHCSICKSDFSIAHSGQYDISTHKKAKKHSDFIKILL